MMRASQLPHEFLENVVTAQPTGEANASATA
jgi:hypothetical protein